MPIRHCDMLKMPPFRTARTKSNAPRVRVMPHARSRDHEAWNVARQHPLPLGEHAHNQSAVGFEIDAQRCERLEDKLAREALGRLQRLCRVRARERPLLSEHPTDELGHTCLIEGEGNLG